MKSAENLPKNGMNWEAGTGHTHTHTHTHTLTHTHTHTHTHIYTIDSMYKIGN